MMFYDLIDKWVIPDRNLKHYHGYGIRHAFIVAALCLFVFAPVYSEGTFLDGTIGMWGFLPLVGIALLVAPKRVFASYLAAAAATIGAFLFITGAFYTYGSFSTEPNIAALFVGLLFVWGMYHSFMNIHHYRTKLIDLDRIRGDELLAERPEPQTPIEQFAEQRRRKYESEMQHENHMYGD